MLTCLEKYNIEKINNLDNTYDCFVKEININNELIKKIFIVDIRKISDKVIDNIFNNFTTFQFNILSDDFFKSNELQENNLFTYSYNMDLIFLYDKSRQYNINKSKILYDMEYAFKRFMTSDELQNFLNKDYTNINLDREKLVELKDKVLKLKSFNYIEGNNGSGKTMLLNDISKSVQAPLFSMNNVNLNLENYIVDKGILKKYFYQLTGSYEFDKYSDYQQYIYRLAQILQFSSEHNNIVLLDDLRWKSLDDRNILNLIDTLFDYSINSKGIVITGYNQSKLIKRRVYRANIIKL